MDLLSNQEIPIGFSMALAKDTNAMNAFSSMTKEQRAEVVAQSRNMHSKEDMEHFVNSFTQNRTY